MAFTLTNIYTFLQDYNRDDTSAKAVRLYTKIANDAMREMYSAGEFDFAKRQTRTSYAAMYNTGTCAVSAGGTAVTGASTVWVSGHVGMYIRFAGESQQYLISAVGGNTALTIASPGYLGTSNLAAGTSYEITDERKAVPTNFRSISRMTVDGVASNVGPIYDLKPLPLMEMLRLRAFRRTVFVPEYYAVEWVYPSSGNVPLAYIWTYPAPQDARVIMMTYNTWPVDLSSGSDETPIPYEAQGIYREFLLAFLYREQGKMAESAQQLSKAKSEALNGLAVTRAIDEGRIRREWTPEGNQNSTRFIWNPRIDPTTPMV